MWHDGCKQIDYLNLVEMMMMMIAINENHCDIKIEYFLFKLNFSWLLMDSN